jgi:cytochrome P450
VLGVNGMSQLAGRALRRDRRLFVPHFQGEALASLGQMMQAATREAMRDWRPGDALVMREVALSIALDIILRAVFGADTEARRAEFRGALRDFDKAFGRPSFLMLAALGLDWDGLPPFRRFAAARGRLEAMLRDMIARARAEGASPRGDVLGRLVAARHDDGTGMPDAALVDNLITTAVAGHETSVVSLCWAMHWLHAVPETLERVLAELAPLGPDATPEALGRLPYLDAVVKEVLRLWPAVTDINRVLAKPMQLGGYEIPAGMTVAASAAILHYDATLHPEPERFQPARFLGRSYAPWEYIPFGGGERMCPGAQFSVHELKVVLGTLLSQGRFDLHDQGPPKLARIGFLVSPADGVRLRFAGPRRTA